jgi:hypothetical protein
LKLKTSSVIIENISKEKISEALIDNSINYKSDFPLFVPIIFKGKTTNLAINSRLILKEINNDIEINLTNSFTKVIIYSLIIGIFPSLIFLLLFSNFELFIGFSILITSIIFLMYYFNIKKVSVAYLVRLKNILLTIH